jgi:hypothetical protein
MNGDSAKSDLVYSIAPVPLETAPKPPPRRTSPTQQSYVPPEKYTLPVLPDFPKEIPDLQTPEDEEVKGAQPCEVVLHGRDCAPAATPEPAKPFTYEKGIPQRHSEVCLLILQQGFPRASSDLEAKSHLGNLFLMRMLHFLYLLHHLHRGGHSNHRHTLKPILRILMPWNTVASATPSA